MRSFQAYFLILPILVSSCTRTAPIDADSIVTLAPAPSQPAGIPTAAPVQTYLPPTRLPGEPISSPTPDGAVMAFPTFTPLADISTQQAAPATSPESQTYTVQPGDFPASIAEQFGMSAEELMAANNLAVDAVIYPGDILQVPVANTPQAIQNNEVTQSVSSSDYFKILPDSELIYGPLSSLLDINTFVQGKGGYLAYYTQDINGETLTGAQIVTRVAHNYSVNPRLLLAILEYRSQWVTNPNPAATTTYTPIGYVDDFHQGLYRQLTWTADMLNQGFYRFKEGKEQSWTLPDGTQVLIQPGVNPGTAGVQHLFAMLDNRDLWKIDTGPDGLFATFNSMFGYPFDLAIEPLLPAELTQPEFILPFQPGNLWQFTSGPHAGWDQGSAWAALDFAPPGEPIGCAPTDAWVTAIAPGRILRADNGAVVEDLDNDGLEQTGWTILYMHIASRDRVQPGVIVQPGDKIGHPSCEGGLADANHLHIARRYNGLWIPAGDSNVPFVMDNYVTSGNETEYDGWLKGHGKTIEAWNGKNSINEIKR